MFFKREFWKLMKN